MIKLKYYEANTQYHDPICHRYLFLFLIQILVLTKNIYNLLVGPTSLTISKTIAFAEPPASQMASNPYF